MSLVHDIGTYLAAQGYGTVGTDIFYDEFQDTPANQIAIFGSGMQGFEVASGGNGIILEDPYFDVQVRNVSKATARDAMENIRRLLQYNTVVTGYYLVMGTPPYSQYFGKDNSNRYRYAAFFVASTSRGL